jgi:transposase-like protein
MDLRAILGIVVGAPTGRGACTAIEPTPTARSMVASAIRMVFEQPDEASARDQCTRVIAMFEPRMSAVARLLADAEPDLLSHFTFPELHRARIRSTNPQERLNKEIQAADRGRRELPAPPRDAVIRLVGMILAEQDDEWQDGRRYFRPETMAALDAPPTSPEEVNPALLMAS